jgi:hypothetical protein
MIYPHAQNLCSSLKPWLGGLLLLVAVLWGLCPTRFPGPAAAGTEAIVNATGYDTALATEGGVSVEPDARARALRKKIARLEARLDALRRQQNAPWAGRALKAGFPPESAGAGGSGPLLQRATPRLRTIR